MNRWLWQGVAAYAIWGTFPLYWSLLRGVPTAQIMGHRIVWSCLVLAFLVGITGRTRLLRSLSRRTVGIYSMAAVLIGVNWTIYVWAVTSGFVVETSLGYFITPLVNVLLGVVVLRERLRKVQWIAVALAAVGVLHLARTSGAPPWIALGLAASFGTYALIKKRAPLPPVEGLFLETAVLTAPAMLFLIWIQRSGEGVIFANHVTDALLFGTGALTVLPLLLFASAVRHVSLSAMGILQFFSPTMQFLFGVFFFQEPFSAAQFIGFVVVWTAVALFTVDSLRWRHAPVLDQGVA